MSWFKSGWNGRGGTPAGGEQDSEEIRGNFTPRAQQVLALARKEADRFHHNFVGTEHVLLGLIRLGQGVAVNVLRKMGVDLEAVRREVENQVGTGPEQVILGNIPYTPRVKKVLALAAKEAKALNHTYVGTEHVLLGLLREGDGVAARVLQILKVDVEVTRREILKELDPNFAGSYEDASPSGSDIAPMPARAEGLQVAQSSKSQLEPIDTSKRYDIYCAERCDELVVYRNAVFNGRKTLLSRGQFDVLADFVELELADGQRIFVARRAIIKFCEHGTTPGSETVPGAKP